MGCYSHFKIMTYVLNSNVLMLQIQGDKRGFSQGNCHRLRASSPFVRVARRHVRVSNYRRRRIKYLVKKTNIMELGFFFFEKQIVATSHVERWSPILTPFFGFRSKKTPFYPLYDSRPWKPYRHIEFQAFLIRSVCLIFHFGYVIIYYDYIIFWFWFILFNFF